MPSHQASNLAGLAENMLAAELVDGRDGAAELPRQTIVIEELRRQLLGRIRPRQFLARRTLILGEFLATGVFAAHAKTARRTIVHREPLAGLQRRRAMVCL
jgi:hypothetical protein